MDGLYWKTLSKLDDLGVLLFLETPLWGDTTRLLVLLSLWIPSLPVIPCEDRYLEVPKHLMRRTLKGILSHLRRYDGRILQD